MKLTEELGLIAVLLVLYAASTSTPKPKAPSRSKGAPGSARDKWDPLSIERRKREALDSGDPAVMRHMANLIRDAGYEAEALELEGAAREIETQTQIP